MTNGDAAIYTMDKLMEPAGRVTPDILVKDVMESMSTEDPLKAVVVVEDDVPVGLVMGTHLERTLSSQFGVHLFYDQSVSTVMDPSPLIVENHTTLETAARLAMAREKSKIYDHIIVRTDGKLSGVVTVWKVLDYLSLVYMEHSAQMKQMNRKLHQGLTELKQVKSAWKAADSAVNDFLSRMSHEIMTPMNSILGMADLLKETELNTEQSDYVQTFQSSGELLLSVVNDILDFYKIEAGQVELESIRFSLRDLVEETGKILAYRAQAKGLELVCRLEPGVHEYMVGDPTRIRQVLVNVVGNAINFTDHGGVFLYVKYASKSEGAEVVEFSVKDSGKGIPPEQLAAILNAFKQTDSMSRESGAVGLGLSISQKLVEYMGGRMWVESRFGEGSTFYFTARLKKGTGPKIERIGEEPDLTGARVLVVDDNRENLRLCRDYLESWSAEVAEAVSAKEAVAEINRSAKARNLFKLILIDSGLPDLDGLELASRISAKAGAPPCLLMFNVSDTTQIRTMPLSPALCNYLVKPITRDGLGKAVLGMIPVTDKTDRTVSGPPSAEPTRLPPLAVLLAEDYLPNRKLVQSFLKKTPVVIDVAENGKVAADKFMAGEYDVVLMDLQMPVMTGFEAAKAIREWEKANGKKETPIIALTAYSLAKHRSQAEDAGCTDFIHKPVKKATLMEALWKVAESDQSRGRLMNRTGESAG